MRYLSLVMILLAGLAFGANDKEKAADSQAIPSDTIFTKCDVEPEIIKEVAPIYPAHAKKDSVEAELWVKAYVDSHGIVKSAKVSKCSHPDAGFEAAALKAAYANNFKPALSGGKPIAVWVSYKVTFKLDAK